MYKREKIAQRNVEFCLLIPSQMKKSFSPTSGFVSYAMQREIWDSEGRAGYLHAKQWCFKRFLPYGDQEV